MRILSLKCAGKLLFELLYGYNPLEIKDFIQNKYIYELDEMIIERQIYKRCFD